MMDKAKKTGALGLLVLGGKPKAEPKDAKEGRSEAKRLAAQGLIDAVKEGDADAVAEAFETLRDACEPAAPEPDEGTDD